MLRQILTVAGLAFLVGTAQAGSLLEAVEQSAEVPLVFLDLPAAEGGLLKFSVCKECETHSVVMSRSTGYLVNNRPVTFEEFADTVNTAQASGELVRRSLVGLYFDTASKRLNRIALVTPVVAR
jgi:hypothetical protein